MRDLARFRRSNPVVQHDPFRNFENFFNDFFDEGQPRRRKMIRPAANIIEDKDGKFCIELSAPGFDKKDFDIELDGRELTVSAKREKQTETEDKKTYLKEFSSYEMERTFTLGEELDGESVQAKYENGILNIYISRKAEDAQEAAKKIEIK